MAEIKIPNMNLVILSGRLVQDPEMRFGSQGRAVARFRIASTRVFRDPASGDWKEDTLFVNVVTFGSLAERCNQRLSKGSPVFVEGRLQSRTYETQSGEKRSVIEVVGLRVQFLEKEKAEEISASPEEELPPEELPPEDELPF
ncbi:MAG: single-stranded DNA-binding protein [Candidatus Hydrothermales bacterium]